MIREVTMITGMSFVSVWVLDQDSAKDFYTKKLGCELTTDLQLDNGMRWLTVRPEGSKGQELLLMDPAHSMLDATTASCPPPASSSSRSRPCAPTGSRRFCATTRGTGTASPSAKPDASTWRNAPGSRLAPISASICSPHMRTDCRDRGRSDAGHGVPNPKRPPRRHRRPRPAQTRDITGLCGTDRANHPPTQPEVMIRRDDHGSTAGGRAATGPERQTRW